MLVVAGVAQLSCRREPEYQAALEHGNALLERDPSASVAEFERAVQLGAKAQGNAGLGRALEELGRLDEALKHFELARLEAPDNRSLGLAVARVKLRLGREAEGRHELELVVAGAPEELPAALLLGVLARTAPEAAKARGPIDRWVSDRSRDGGVERWLEVEAVQRELDLLEGKTQRSLPKAARLLNAKLGLEIAQVLAQKGRVDTARELLAAVRAQQPDEGAAWLRGVSLELELGNLAVARRLIERAPQAERAKPPMLELEAKLARRAGEHRRSSALFAKAANGVPAAEIPRRRALLLAQAEELLAAAAPDEAEAALKRLSVQHGDFSAARLVLAGLLSRVGRHDDATAEAKRALELDPGNAGAHDVLISVLVAAKRTAAANEACERYAKAFPSLAGPLILEALLVAPEDSAKAGKLLDRALELEPGSLRAIVALSELPAGEQRLERHAEQHRSWAAYLRLGELRKRRGDGLGAERAIVSATEAGSTVPDTWSRLVDFYQKSGRSERALVAAERWTQAMPARVESWKARAELERSLGRSADAIRSYERCLALNPGLVPALNNLAMLLLRPPADAPRAVELAERARQEAPDSPAIADTLGWALLQRGHAVDLQRAGDLLTRAAGALDSPEAYYHAGAALLAARSPEAQQFLERSVREGAVYEGLPEARRLLAEARAGTPRTSEAAPAPKGSR